MACHSVLMFLSCSLRHARPRVGQGCTAFRLTMRCWSKSTLLFEVPHWSTKTHPPPPRNQADGHSLEPNRPLTFVEAPTYFVGASTAGDLDVIGRTARCWKAGSISNDVRFRGADSVVLNYCSSGEQFRIIINELVKKVTIKLFPWRPSSDEDVMPIASRHRSKR